MPHGAWGKQRGTLAVWSLPLLAGAGPLRCPWVREEAGCLGMGEWRSIDALSSSCALLLHSCKQTLHPPSSQRLYTFSSEP